MHHPFVIVEAVEARRLFAGTPTFTVTVIDPDGDNAIYVDRIRATLLAAANDWGRNIDSSAHIELRVDFDPEINALATGGASGREAGTFRGKTVFESDVIRELRTGDDQNGADPDGLVTINPAYLPTTFFDPDPADRTTAVPPGFSDAYSVLLHETGHVLGFLGAQQQPDGSVPSGSLWTFNKFVVTEGGNVFFNGTSAVAVYGGRVPLNVNSTSHLGNNAPRPGADLQSDLMNPILRSGTRYTISDLDLAILRDIGVPMKATAGNGGGDPEPPGSNTVAFNAKTKATFTDPAGVAVTVTLKGAGSGTITLDDAGAATITVTGGTAKTTLTLKSARRSSVKYLSVAGVGKIDAKNTDLTGTLTAANATSITLADLRPGATVDIAAAARPASLTARNVSESTVTSAVPLNTVKVASWTDADGTPDTLTAPRLGTLTSSGPWQADITVAGDVSKLTVGGALSTATISAAGSIGSLTAGSITGSTITAGGATGDAFARPAAQIKSLTIKSKAAGAFAGSTVTAPAIGKAKLGRVTVTNGGDVFGVTARSIRTVSAVTPAQPKFSQKAITAAGGAYNEGDFEVRLLA